MGGTFRIVESKGQLSLVRDWRKLPGLRHQIAFTLFWNLSAWFSILEFHHSNLTLNGVHYATLAEAINHYPSITIMMFFPFVGGALAYHCVVRWLNRTSLIHDQQSLFVRRKPLVWLTKNHCFELSHLESFELRRHRITFQGEEQVPVYQLIIRYHGLDFVIESDISHPEDVRLIQQWMREMLTSRCESAADEAA